MRNRASAVVVVPVSLGSTRLPGKALLAETGRPLFLHVVERAAAAKRPRRVVVATDEERIVSIAREARLEVVKTGEARTGTDRVWQAVASSDEAIVVNLQGDEPLMDPGDIDRSIDAIDAGASRTDIVTIAQRIASDEELHDPNVVKVVVDSFGRALYFSRAPIPYRREPEANPLDGGRVPCFHHRGIYAFTRSSLERFTQLPASPLEAMEKLEQLRALEAGFAIRVLETERRGFGINVPEDYRRFVEEWKRSSVAGSPAGSCRAKEA
jgi:3-deoxy-manno-octulosonate cytidylyltransferase (CMP-KDO synthetase)